MVAFNGDVTLDKVKAGGIRKNLKLKMGGSQAGHLSDPLPQQEHCKKK